MLPVKAPGEATSLVKFILLSSTTRILDVTVFPLATTSSQVKVVPGAGIHAIPVPVELNTCPAVP